MKGIKGFVILVIAVVAGLFVYGMVGAKKG
jgi:hypothetical protein